MNNKRIHKRILSAVLAIALLLCGALVWSAAADNTALKITADGGEISELVLSPYEKVELAAVGLEGDADYQWQIRHPENAERWVNIYDAVEETISVSKALVQNVLDENDSTQLRCTATMGEERYCSAPVTVILRENMTAAANSGIMLLADEDETTDEETETPEFVTVTIEYIRYDFKRDDNNELVCDEEGNLVLDEQGYLAFTSYVATLQYNSDLNTSVNNPMLVGYQPYLDDAPVNAVDINLTNIQQNVIYQVKYRPAEVNYAVRYYFQNIYDDLYVEDTNEKVQTQGYTGATPAKELVTKEFPGFTSLYYQPDSIAADGSTVFEVYYERNYYLMEFDCNGGYGTETLYVRYGTYISVPLPTKSGWNFVGWDLVRADGNLGDDENDEQNKDKVRDLTLVKVTKTVDGQSVETVVAYITDLITKDADGNITAYNGEDIEDISKDNIISCDDVADTLPATLPYYNTAYKALWTAEDTSYSVVYWILNSDGSQTYRTSYTKNAVSATVVSGQDDICGTAVHTHTADCYVCGKVEHTHHAHSFACYSGIAQGDETTAASNANDWAAIQAANAAQGDNFIPQSGYLYLIQSDTDIANNIYWPKMYMNGSYYTVTVDGSGSIGDTVLASIVDGASIGSAKVQGGYTATIYKAKVTNCSENCPNCEIDEHIHVDTCFLCEPDEHSHDGDCVLCGYAAEHTHTDACDADIRHFEFVRADQDVVVQGDGSTVVNVYYQYKEYTLKFYYAASKTTGTGDTATTNYYVVGGSTYYFGYHNGTDTDDDIKQLYKMFVTNSSQVGQTADGAVPSLNQTGEKRVTAGTYTMGSEYDSTSGYTYYHISFTARYGEDITDKWPCDVFSPVKMAEGNYNTIWGTDSSKTSAMVSAWNGEHHVKYSQEHGNETIKGKYEKLDNQLLFNSNYEDATTVSYLCFWENGAKLSDNNQWNIPKLFRYNIWLEVTVAELQKDENGAIVFGEDGNPIHIDGETPVKQYNNNNNNVYYKRIEVYDTCDNSDVTQQTQPSLTGYSQNGYTSDELTGSTDAELLEDEETYFDSSLYSEGYAVHFYYKAQEYTLSLSNRNETLEEVSGIDYGTSLTSYGSKYNADVMWNEHYPAGLEPGAYEFKGWYTTAECYDGSEVQWDSLTMPDSDLALYAEWEPVTHNVYFYYLYTDIEAKNYWDTTDNTGSEFENSEYPIEVSHGALLGTTYTLAPEREGYVFIGWFYMDEDNKKRFAPDTMEITRDLHLFAEWQSGIDTTYSVTYVLKEDVIDERTSEVLYPQGTVVADPTEGHSTAGKTKTFSAKGLTELYEDFRTGYFPTVNSHSILMAETTEDNPEPNQFVFEYVYDQEVWYKIRYVDDVTGAELAPSVVMPTQEAIVTAKFKPIVNYLPQSYYIRKTLASDGTLGAEDNVLEENVITFYYNKDTAHGLYSVEYYLENVDSTFDPDHENAVNPDYFTQFFSQADSIVGSADLNAEITAAIRSYDGYVHESKLDTVITYDADGTEEIKVGEGLTGEVDYTGLTIRVYYTRMEYAYAILYKEYGTETELKTLTETDDKKAFGTTVSHTALASFKQNDNLYEYYISGASEEELTKEMTIRAYVEGQEENPNVMTFYYVKRQVQIQYYAVWKETLPQGQKAGRVSISSENQGSSAIQGAYAWPEEGFIFVGWYTDEACTKPVENEGWLEGTKLTPEPFQDDDWINEYYALFEPVQEDLKIIKSGTGLSATDSFLFKIEGTDVLGNQIDLTVSIQGEGSVTIRDLYCGDYTVTELTDWSWTYSTADASEEVTLTTRDKDEDGNDIQIQTYEVTFINAPGTVDWLHGEAFCENQFKINATA